MKRKRRHFAFLMTGLALSPIIVGGFGPPALAADTSLTTPLQPIVKSIRLIARDARNLDWSTDNRLAYSVHGADNIYALNFSGNCGNASRNDWPGSSGGRQ